MTLGQAVWLVFMGTVLFVAGLLRGAQIQRDHGVLQKRDDHDAK